MFGRKSLVFVALAFLQITKQASAQSSTATTSATVAPSPLTSTSPPPPEATPPKATPIPSKIYLTLPSNVTAGLGDPVHFLCGVPKSSGSLTFTFQGSAHNYTLTCPGGHIEDIPQALAGQCIVHLDELLATWVLKGASISDKGSKVLCQGKGHPAAPAAYLHVYDNGSGKSLLIGIAVGGCVGVIVVFGLLYLTMTRSESFRTCFRGTNRQPEDLTEIMDDIEPTATSNPTLSEKMRNL